MNEQWLASELYSHTQHSDGDFTVMTLSEAAVANGIEFLAITDHNTIVPREEVEEAMKQTGIKIINALEWTSFYGQMVVMGMSGYVDWRGLAVNNISDGIKNIQAMGGIAGVAHPFSVGTPLCMGCFWQYDIEDWSEVDYLEVWSFRSPKVNACNIRAFELWDSLLNKGHKITGTCGLDWHKPTPDGLMTVVAYIEIDKGRMESYQEQIISSIKNGKVTVSMGPLMLLDAVDQSDQTVWGIGDTINVDLDTIVFEVKLDYNLRKNHWNFDDPSLKVVLVSEQGVIDEQTLIEGYEKITFNPSKNP